MLNVVSDHSIRFAPPLVIEESDLRKGISIIEESLRELDEVSITFLDFGSFPYRGPFHSSLTVFQGTKERRREPSSAWRIKAEPAAGDRAC
jgi:hypothetical protein